MISAINQTVLFLVQTVFNLYMMVLLIRILLEWMGANYYNPIVQLLLKFTDPLIKPISRYIRLYKRFNMAGLCILFLIGIIKLYITVLLQTGALANVLGIFIWTLGELINLSINIFFYALLIQAILSWISPHNQHPAIELLYLLTTPILTRVRQFIPPIAGFDLSLLVTMIGLQAIAILFVQFITSYGVLLSVGHQFS